MYRGVMKLTKSATCALIEGSRKSETDNGENFVISMVLLIFICFVINGTIDDT